MRTLIRAAASRQTGLGHLLRQVALVERLEERGVATTFVVDDPSLARTALARFPWPGGGPPVQGTDDWLTGVSAADVVVFDGYRFGPDDHLAARGTGAAVVAVDDRGHGRFDVDLLCDHNPLTVDYDLPEGSRLLHGPRFALVRREFLGGRRPAPDDADHLLVAFGGSDAAGLLPAALHALADRSAFPHVTVLVGPGTDAATLVAPPGVELAVAPPAVAPLHAQADAALITVGTTVWELMARTTPTAAIGLDDRHAELVEVLVARGALVDAGTRDTWIDELPATLDRLADEASRRELQAGARGLVDGRGPDRVAEAVLGLAGG